MTQGQPQEGENKEPCPESKSEKVETKAENRERSEVAATGFGVLIDQIQARISEQRQTGRSGATKYNVPSAEALLGDGSKHKDGTGPESSETIKEMKAASESGALMGAGGKFVPQEAKRSTLDEAMDALEKEAELLAGKGDGGNSHYVPAGSPIEIRGQKYELNELTAELPEVKSDASEKKTENPMSGTPSHTGADGKPVYEGHVTNVPEVTKGVQNLQDLKDLSTGIGQGLGNAALQGAEYLAKPNAVDNSLLQIGPALDNAVNYYANTQAEKVGRDFQQFAATGAQALDDALGHPMKASETGKFSGELMPMFIPLGGKRPLNAKELEALGGAEKLEQMSAKELEALGVGKAVDTGLDAAGNILSFDKASGIELKAARAGQDGLWKEAPMVRGNDVHVGLGENLPPNTKTIDRIVFKDGVVESIKSIDPRDVSYATDKGFESKIDSYLDDLENYRGRETKSERGLQLRERQISEKVLHIGIPDSAISPGQVKALEEIGKRLVQYNEQLPFGKAPVKLKVTVLK